MAYRPLHDKVIIKRFEEQEKSAGGIIIPDTAKEKPQQGKVIAVGTGIRYQRRQNHPVAGKAGRPRALQQVRRDGSQVLR